MIESMGSSRLVWVRSTRRQSSFGALKNHVKLGEQSYKAGILELARKVARQRIGLMQTGIEGQCYL